MRSGGLVATASSGPVQVSKVFYIFCHLRILICFSFPLFFQGKPSPQIQEFIKSLDDAVCSHANVFHFKKTKHPDERHDNSFIPGVAEQFIQPAAEPDIQPSGGGPLRADVQGARPEPVRASGLGAQQLLLQGAQGRNQLGAVQVNPKWRLRVISDCGKKWGPQKLAEWPSKRFPSDGGWWRGYSCDNLW